MAITTGIEWTDATWNPVTGCTKVGPGCDNCYVERFAERWRGVAGHSYEQGFDLRLRPERLGRPARWRRPRAIFVNSMSDLFHKDVPEGFIDAVFGAMEDVDRHIYQVLTKRSSAMRDYVNRRYVGAAAPGHIRLGVSIEDRDRLGRLDHLRQTAAAIRFVSFEPLLGPLGAVDLAGVHWVIAGGESGPGARPMHPDWARGIRDRCLDAGVPFFFKQWGDWAISADLHSRGIAPTETRHPWGIVQPRMARAGKKRTGRMLDGRTWDDMPPP